MAEVSFFNQVIAGTIEKMDAQVEALMGEFPLPPGYDELKRTKDFVSWWNKALPQQRAQVVAQLGENAVMSALIMGRRVSPGSM